VTDSTRFRDADLAIVIPMVLLAAQNHVIVQNHVTIRFSAHLVAPQTETVFARKM